jgi:hypothetical protein
VYQYLARRWLLKALALAAQLTSQAGGFPWRALLLEWWKTGFSGPSRYRSAGMIRMPRPSVDVFTSERDGSLGLPHQLIGVEVWLLMMSWGSFQVLTIPHLGKPTQQVLAPLPYVIASLRKVTSRRVTDSQE